MGAGDVSPDRATRARYAIADFLSAAHDARVGLVVFAGEQHVVAPLTTDVETVRALLQPLAPELMPEAGDKLAPALDEAGRLLQAVGAGHGRVVVLSDGFADQAQSLQAAQRLRQKGNTVDIVGVGTARGAPEPDGEGGFVHDAQGRSVLARMPTDLLQRVAAAGGGSFVPLSGVAHLIATLQAESSRTLDAGAAAPGMRVESWSNGGVWLLPLLLLLAALVARRGWL
jgi:Ca-activated chloride channel family protein